MSSVVTEELPPAETSKSLAPAEIKPAVAEQLQKTKFIDVHTYLFMPSLCSLGLWGNDELLTDLLSRSRALSAVQPAAYFARDKFSFTLAWVDRFSHLHHLPPTEGDTF